MKQIVNAEGLTQAMSVWIISATCTDGRDFYFMQWAQIPFIAPNVQPSLSEECEAASCWKPLKEHRHYWSEIRTGMLVVPMLVNLSF